ncbi:hypothetical protein A0H76_1714 [Hepatospora eriocheir]|uniref:Uncharacterized protein n=1 Tax=Hepatospora eriocheir TaxID=1081669 RepID=A0A1X0QGL8_9MICR|nr:hypothetical protein A0H76_1714 [Hepatospora eriocheir]
MTERALQFLDELNTESKIDKKFNLNMIIDKTLYYVALCYKKLFLHFITEISFLITVFKSISQKLNTISKTEYLMTPRFYFIITVHLLMLVLFSRGSHFDKCFYVSYLTIILFNGYNSIKTIFQKMFSNNESFTDTINGGYEYLRLVLKLDSFSEKKEDKLNLYKRTFVKTINNMAGDLKIKKESDKENEISNVIKKCNEIPEDIEQRQGFLKELAESLTMKSVKEMQGNLFLLGIFTIISGLIIYFIKNYLWLILFGFSVLLSLHIVSEISLVSNLSIFIKTGICLLTAIIISFIIVLTESLFVKIINSVITSLILTIMWFISLKFDKEILDMINNIMNFTQIGDLNNSDVKFIMFLVCLTSISLFFEFMKK